MAVLELEHEVVNQDAEIPFRPAHPVLLEMAELISRRGWCQGKYEEEETGALCVMGAFYEMLARDNTWPLDDCWEAPYYYGLQAFEQSVAQDFDFSEGELLDAADWNDVPGRTKFQVIDRLRRVGLLGR